MCLITDVYGKKLLFTQYRDKISVFSAACRIDLFSHVSLLTKKCLLYWITVESSCSESGVGSAILPLLACKRDMTSNLVNLGIGGKRGRGEAEVSESELILNRAGRIGILREDEKEALTICPKHRKHLTTDWPGRKNCICCYPAHQGLKKRLSLAWRVNAKISAEVFVEFKEIAPIGAGEWRLLFIPSFS